MDSKNKLYYRVITSNEIVGESINSMQNLTCRQQIVNEFYPQMEAICMLSLQCDIKLSSALRIASQYGYVIDDIQDAIQCGCDVFLLNKLLVSGETKDAIPLKPLVDFIVNYNRIYNESGIYLDEDRNDGQYIWEGVWEYVRRRLFSHKNSRLASIFAFEKMSEAKQFSESYRNDTRDIVTVEIEDAKVERYDMEWLTKVPITSTMIEASVYATNYWEGKSTDTPCYEFLVKGTYKLLL